jgi:hypothetical protein
LGGWHWLLIYTPSTVSHSGSKKWDRNSGKGALFSKGGTVTLTPLNQSLPNSPILFLPKPYLVLRDTLCSCEAYGRKPMYKKEKMELVFSNCGACMRGGGYR